MTAEEVVAGFAAGVGDALKTKEFFLGVEEFAFKNADIHPEYVTTVKVAERLTGPDREVVLEALMRLLKSSALGQARMKKASNSTIWPALQQKLLHYNFGKKRLDILVRRSDPASPPLLFAEAKLGVRNVTGVCEDVDRVMTLLAMYDDLDLLSAKTPYSAVVFHVMEEGGTDITLDCAARALVSAVDARLAHWQSARPWLNWKAGLLKRAQVVAPVSGYEEHYSDGTSETVFAKESFAFAPGLVLMGPDPDIRAVQF